MRSIILQDAFQLGDCAPMDWLLRFVAPIQARYDEENAARRVKELRSAIFVGLALYNVYNITSLVLLPDCLLISIILRLGIVTPTSLALAWVIGRLSPRWTEHVITIGVLNAYAIPVFLFWLSREPLGLFTFGELPLTIVFANMLMALRFLNAIVFTCSALGITLLAVGTKSGLEGSLVFAFAVQITTACAFGLYANYRQERRRGLDFLVALSATLEAESAQAHSQAYQDLSRKDALTGIPNRRHLTERLDALLSERRAVSVMMIDIDHFKAYNDALGHLAGDDCLCRVAKAFAYAASQTVGGFCARFGGEEFTFVLPGAEELEIARLARSILKTISDLAIPHPARSDGMDIITVSIGVAQCAGGLTHSLHRLLSDADRSLYAAKRQGRNRFAFKAEIEHSLPIDKSATSRDTPAPSAGSL